MTAPRRLPSETFTLLCIGGELPDGSNAEHLIEVSLTWLPSGALQDIIFVTRGKIGQGMDLFLNDLGVQLSRAIQGRNPAGDEG